MSTVMGVPWDEMQRLLVERMEATINADPRVRLEVDGGPVAQTADVILARFYGFDEQVDRDLRLTDVRPDLLFPIPQRPTIHIDSDWTVPTMPVARYVLQSSFARMNLAPEYAPPDVRPGPPDFLVSVLFVRYKRR